MWHDLKIFLIQLFLIILLVKCLYPVREIMLLEIKIKRLLMLQVIMNRLLRTSRPLGLSIFQTWDPDSVEESETHDDGTALGRLRNVFERE